MGAHPTAGFARSALDPTNRRVHHILANQVSVVRHPRERTPGLSVTCPCLLHCPPCVLCFVETRVLFRHPQSTHNSNPHLKRYKFSSAFKGYEPSVLTRMSEVVKATAVGDSTRAVAAPQRVCQLCFRCEFSRYSTCMVSTTVVHKFLQDKAIPSPFLFAYLSELSKKTNTINICGNCDSWIRRQAAHSKTGGVRGKKVFLLVDQLILCIMLPGTYGPPEMRITQRLINTIRQNGGENWLGTICPPLVVRAICDNDIVMVSRQVLKSICVAAWRSGRRQVVLGNATFAKHIRCGHQTH